METAPKFLFVVLAVFCACFDASSSTASYCYKETCRECAGDIAYNKGKEMKCDFRSVVSPTLLDGVDRPGVDVGVVDTDYACVKMVASDSTVSGDSTDVIKGCAFAKNAKNICDLLVGEELSRNKKNARCYVCYDDYCNGSFGVKSSILLIAITAVLAKILNH